MTTKFELPVFEPEGATVRAPQSSRRDLLEATKLSRLPRRDNVLAFQPALCVGCGRRIDRDEEIQKAFRGCRKCIGIYARLDVAFAETSEQRKKQTLERFAGGGR